MRVEVNALNFAMSVMLLINCEDKKWRLIAYISKLLNKAIKL